jgi:hypothetical protein
MISCSIKLNLLGYCEHDQCISAASLLMNFLKKTFLQGLVVCSTGVSSTLTFVVVHVLMRRRLGYCLCILTNSFSYLRFLEQMEHQFLNGYVNIYLN